MTTLSLDFESAMKQNTVVRSSSIYPNKAKKNKISQQQQRPQQEHQ